MASDNQPRAATIAHEWERAVTAGILVGGLRSFDEASDAGLRTADFSEGSPYARFFDAFASLAARGEAIEPLSVLAEFDRTGSLSAVGGKYAVDSLALAGREVGGVRLMARKVRDAADFRRLAQAAHHILTAALDQLDTPAAILAQAQTTFLGLNQRSTDDMGIVDRVATVARIIENVHKPEAAGISSGFASLDRAIEGFKPGQLWYVAGRTSMGKSAFAGALAANMSGRMDVHTAQFNGEMGGEQIIARDLAAESGTDSRAWRDDRAAFDRMFTVAGAVAEWKHYVIPEDLDLATIRSKSRRLIHNYGVRLIFVDYVGLVRGGSRYAGDRVREVGEISRSLKAMALELKVPVVALSQLNRECDKRSPPRPYLADLRDSGDLEQDADGVMLLYRPEYYFKDKTPEEDKGIVEVIIAKQRSGKTTTVRLGFDAKSTRFGELDNDVWTPPSAPPDDRDDPWRA